MRPLIAFLVGVLLLSTPSVAMAAGFGDTGNSHVQIETPAYVTGDLWTRGSGVFATVAREHNCWYPQSWWDSAVIAYEDGQVLSYNTSAPHYLDVQAIVAQASGDAGDAREPIDFFAEIRSFTDRSCIQEIFIARDDCSTDDMIAVLSTSAVRDAYRGLTLSVGSFDDHDLGGLYCLVVIQRDPWLELVEDQALVPDPVRATFPQLRTLVGLDNSVWYEVATGDNLTNGGFSVTIPTAGNDYSLTLDIWLAGIRVDIDGDGIWEFEKSCSGSTADVLEPCAGSAEDPVYTFEYQTRAFHAFTIQTLWAGQAVGPAGEILNIDPGLLLNDYTFDWETAEVRSSLDN